MSKWFDQYNMIHDRSLDGDYRSGNAPWYSALYLTLKGGDFEKAGVNRLRVVLLSKFIIETIDHRFKTFRYPDNYNPDSHDNLLAHIYFKTITLDILKNSNYYFNNYKNTDHTWLECFKDIYRLIKDHGWNPHRNAWWEGGYYAIGKLANRLPMWLRWYASRELKYLPFLYLHLFVSWIKPNFKKGKRWKIFITGETGRFKVRQTNNVSAKIQCWFLLRTTGSKYLVKLFDIKKLASIYFDYEDHPIRQALRG